MILMLIKIGIGGNGEGVEWSPWDNLIMDGFDMLFKNLLRECYYVNLSPYLEDQN
jgi:hypothetical protein